MSEINPILNPENVCMKCLKTSEPINVIRIGPLGYGSIFDSTQSEIHLCNDCYKKSDQRLWDLELEDEEELTAFFSQDFLNNCRAKDEKFAKRYKYEDEIEEYVNSFPIEGQELFWNRYMKDEFFPEDSKDPYDWCNTVFIPDWGKKNEQGNDS